MWNVVRALALSILVLTAGSFSGGFRKGQVVISAQGWGTVQKSQGVYPFDTAYHNNIAPYESYVGTSMSFVLGFSCGSDWPGLVANTGSQITSIAPSNKPIYWGLCLPDTGATMAALAAGAYDIYLNQLADAYLAARPSDSVIVLRPFQEANNPAVSWTAVGIEPTWKVGWQHLTQVFLKKSLKFRFVWNPNYSTTVNGATYDPGQYYPGDAFVDAVGMDVYYISSIDGTDPNAAWRLKVSSPYGLNWLVTFGLGHNKPISLPEWGVDSDTASAYVSDQLEWLIANNVAFYAYFNANNGPLFQNQLNTNTYPTTGARFIQEFKAPGKTNLLADANSFGTANWVLGQATITAAQADPYGGTTASSLLETATTNNHYIQQGAGGNGITVPASTASFTGVISASGVLTASAVTGTIAASSAITGSGVPAGANDYPAKVKYQITGTAGGAGTYQLDKNNAASSIAMIATPTYRMWIDVKAHGRNWAQFNVGQPASFASGAVSYFDAAAGLAGANVFAYGQMGWTSAACFPSPQNQFYRCAMEFTSVGQTVMVPQFLAASADGTNNYAGDITKGLDIYTGWLRQLNFLLERDLDPASNDNSPMWLEKAA